MKAARIMKRFAGAALAGLMGVLAAPGAAGGLYEAIFSSYGIPMSDTLQEADEAVAAGDYKRAEDLLIPLADGGDADAQVMLGMMYANEQLFSDRDGNAYIVHALVCAAHAEGHPIARNIADGTCD
jgi:hypothetical protein